MLKFLGFVFGGIVLCSIMVLVANSSIGFSAQTLTNASSGLNALMKLMMSWTSIPTIGTLAGILMYLLDRFFINPSTKSTTQL